MIRTNLAIPFQFVADHCLTFNLLDTILKFESCDLRLWAAATTFLPLCTCRFVSYTGATTLQNLRIISLTERSHPEILMKLLNERNHRDQFGGGFEKKTHHQAHKIRINNCVWVCLYSPVFHDLGMLKPIAILINF